MPKLTDSLHQSPAPDIPLNAPRLSTHARLTLMIGLSLAFILAVTLSTARADGNHIIIGPNTTADAEKLSGWPSHDNHTPRQPGNGAILYGIGGSEEGDKPCHIELLWSRQNDTEHRLFTTEWHRAPCGPNRTKSFDETRLAIAPPQSAIRAIKVCTNKKKNRRLKGVQITGVSEITEFAGQKISNPKITGEYKRANCAEWHNESACPAAHVAVGIKIYHDEEGATGLRLICASAGLDPQQEEGVFTEKIEEGEHLLSPVAGTPGAKMRVMIGDGVSLPNDPLRYYGITEIWIVEEADKPCRIRIYGGALHPLKGPDNRPVAEASTEDCGKGDPYTWIDKISPSITHLEDHFVSGVQVCDSKNKNNNRIKGLGLHPSKVEKNAVVRPWKWPQLIVPGESKDRQKNCGPFGTTPETEAKYCPDTNNMVAVGVVMHTDGKSFTGMQLVCRRVTAGFIDPLKKDEAGY